MAEPVTALRISIGTRGCRRSATTAQALRDGRYATLSELRLRDDGSPRLFDLSPKDQVRAADGSIPAATSVPLIRLRTFSPALTGFDPIAAAIDVYDALTEQTDATDDDAFGNDDPPMPARVRAMFAAYAVSETPEMRLVAAAPDCVCAVAAPTPWSAAYALVLRRPKSGGFVPIASTPVEDSLAAIIAPSVCVTDGGRTMDATRIETVQATFVHCLAADMPTAIDAMRTLAHFETRGTAA